MQGIDQDNFMPRAMALAQRGKGKTAPNPSVGAVLVIDGQVVAEGWHERYGQEHAEAMAIRKAKEQEYDLARSSLWVTLEPCNHYGKTPPCSQAIVEAGIREVFIGTRDPNQNVQGGGADYLRAHGIVVYEGVMQGQCQDLIADFLIWQNTERPYICLKLATTLDGKIATRTGHSTWISGPESRAEVHRLRQQVQAVLIGGKTFYSDDPRLTSRLDNSQSTYQPLAVIVTDHLPTSNKDWFLLRERKDQLIFLISQSNIGSQQAKELISQGIEIWPLPQKENYLDLLYGLQRLRQEKGCYSILCEGGGRLALSLVDMGLVDEINLFLAPKILGDQEAVSSFSGRCLSSMNEVSSFRVSEYTKTGEDLWIRLRPVQILDKAP